MSDSKARAPRVLQEKNTPGINANISKNLVLNLEEAQDYLPKKESIPGQRSVS